MTYHRDMFSEHLLLHPMSAPMTLRWLIDRFADRPIEAPSSAPPAHAVQPDHLSGDGASAASSAG